MKASKLDVDRLIICRIDLFFLLMKLFFGIFSLVFAKRRFECVFGLFSEKIMKIVQFLFFFAVET